MRSRYSTFSRDIPSFRVDHFATTRRYPHASTAIKTLFPYSRRPVRLRTDDHDTRSVDRCFALNYTALGIPLRWLGVFFHHTYTLDYQTISLTENLQNPPPLSLLVPAYNLYRISLPEVHVNALAGYRSRIPDGPPRPRPPSTRSGQSVGTRGNPASMRWKPENTGDSQESTRTYTTSGARETMRMY